MLYAQQKKFSQTLEWSEDENAFEYKIEIQSLATGKSTFYETDESYITFSIEAGEYRYRVIALDFLENEASVSDWQNFTITKAKTPKVEELKENVVISEDKARNFSIPVDVTSITEETKVVLINEKTKEEIKGSLDFVKKGSESVASSAVFPEVKEGEWKMKITNPSGLYSETEVIEITKTTEKAVEIVKENPKEKRANEKITALALKSEEQIAGEEKARLAAEEAERKEKERLAAEEKRLAEEKARLAAEEAERKEKERLAAEEKRVAEEKARLAAEEAERKEKERLAAEEKRVAEEKARLAAEEAERKEKERLAAEEKRVAEEKARLAAEEAERKEKERLAAEEKRKNYEYKDVIVSLGGGIVQSLYDGQFLDLVSNTEVFQVTPIMDVKISYLPFDLGKNKLGFEIAVDGYQFKKFNAFYKLETSSLMTNFELVYHQRIVKEKLYLALKAGAGIDFIQKKTLYTADEVQRKNPDDKMYGYIDIQGGASLFINPVKPFVIEIGGDYNHVFIKNMKTGFIKPYINLGFRL